MGQRGRKAAEGHFNWATQEQTLLSFYAALLTERVILKTDTAMI
jgi:hypothetical protein